MFDNFRQDVDRWVYMGGRSALYCILTRQGLWALAEYRFSRWVHTRVRIPVLSWVLKAFGFAWHKLVEITTGIDIPEQAEIGKGLYIGHFGGIFLHGAVKMGEYCNISHGVTIGLGGRGDNRGSPVIGDRVFIGPGAKLIGRIVVGNDVAIGANAVVTKDLPDRAVAVGIPARVVSYEGSREYVPYRGRPVEPEPIHEEEPAHDE